MIIPIDLFLTSNGRPGISLEINYNLYTYLSMKDEREGFCYYLKIIIFQFAF